MSGETNVQMKRDGEAGRCAIPSPNYHDGAAARCTGCLLDVGGVEVESPPWAHLPEQLAMLVDALVRRDAVIRQADGAGGAGSAGLDNVTLIGHTSTV